MIPFSFDKDQHRYTVAGHYTLATGDVIAMAGLCDFGSVPKSTLDHASWRGDQVHQCVQLFEEDDLDMESVPSDIEPYFQGYMRFRAEHDVELIGDCEAPVVYEHTGTGQMIGCHIDLRGFVDGSLYVLDIKSCFKYTGAAKKQLHLRWRMQLQSYQEATEADEAFWTAAQGPIKKAVVHVNKEGGYDFVDFGAIDDSYNWDSLVRIAQLKLANGYKMPQK